MPTTASRRLKNPLTWVIALTLVYLIILAIRPSEAFFGVPGQWTWSGRPPAASTLPRWWMSLALLALLFGAGIWYDKKWDTLSRWHRGAVLISLAVCIPLLQIALKYVHYPYPLEYYLRRTIGPHNGFWQAAISIDAIGAYLRTYPDYMRAASGVFVHLPVHPPGNIVYLWGWRKVFEFFPSLGHSIAHYLRGYNCADLAFVTLRDSQIAAALGQMLTPLFSGLTILPLYAWGKRLRDARTGWRAALLFSFIPALSLFTMRWDSAYPFFAVLAFAWLHRGLDTGKARWWFLAGLVISIASFCSFGNATFAPAVALYAALYSWQKSPGTVAKVWKSWLALILGGYTVWGIYHGLTGISVWDIFATTLETHLNLGRTYWPWIFYNLYDLVAFAGVPIGFLFMVQSARAWLNVPRRRQHTYELPALTISGVVLVLNFSGVVRGEVGRMWLPWMPIVALAAVLWLTEKRNERGYPLLAGLMALQCLWMTLFLRVSPTGMPSYFPRQPGNPAVAIPLQVTFEQDIRLVGYVAEPEQTTPGETVDLILYWQAGTRPDLPYTVFAHLIDADGILRAQNDSMPAANTLPTSCWLPGEVVEDHRSIAIPADAPPGAYTASVGLYYLPTLIRLPITDGGEGDFFRLPFTITIIE
ncbi:MAG: glycosyltransferase family 39 protein [Anaerolineae bacterium]|nr:glycosyltransferase family 39 protein [Anaerolineae bacterium]